MKLILVLALSLSPIYSAAVTSAWVEVCPQVDATVSRPIGCTETPGTFPHPSPASISVETAIGSGQFSGSGSASTSVGIMRVSTNLTLHNYALTSEKFTGVDADSSWSDFVTLAGAPGPYTIEFTFDLDGALSSNTPWITNIFHFSGHACPVVWTGQPGESCFDSSVVDQQNLILPSTVVVALQGITSQTFEVDVYLASVHQSAY